MPVLKAAVLVFVLVSLFSAVQSQQLNCACTGTCSDGNMTLCLPNEVCYASKSQVGGTENKGCIDRDECDDIGFCPNDPCLSYGCCTTDKCVANSSLIKAVDSPLPTPTPTTVLPPVVPPAPTSSPVALPAPTSSPVVVPARTSSPVAVPVVTSTVPPEASSSAAAMTTNVPVVKPASSSAAMPFMSATTAMTSSQPEVKPSSPAKGMRPTPTGSIYATKIFVSGTEDPRPPCDVAARSASLRTFVLIAVALLLCGMF